MYGNVNQTTATTQEDKDMTQLEILELAYGAAVDQWSAAKEKNEAAKEEGRPNTIYGKRLHSSRQ